jgi:maltose alpha-D-glucosyltransferase/alpha-amylase
LEDILAKYILSCRWFVGQSRVMQGLSLQDIIPIPYQNQEAAIVLLKVEYTEGFPETYVLPLAYATGESAQTIQKQTPQAVIAALNVGEESGILFDAIVDPAFMNIPRNMVVQRRTYAGKQGRLVAIITEATKQLEQMSTGLDLQPHIEERSNSNALVVYGNRLVFKLFRRLEEGINPELEIRRFLGDKQHLEQQQLEHIAPAIGGIEYRSSPGVSMTLGVLQAYVPDAISAWTYTLDSLRDYFEKIVVQPSDSAEVTLPTGSLFEMQSSPIPEIAAMTIGSYLTNIQLLGQRTAELHIALSSDSDNPDFSPLPFSSFYQRSIYQYSRNLTGQTLLRLKKQLRSLPEDIQGLARQVISRKDYLLTRLEQVLTQKITAMRTRCHGNYCLEEVLYTGKDFAILDFEGETYRTLNERRMKRSPLRDVAGMILSFDSAARVALKREVDQGMIQPENLAKMEHWTQLWSIWVSATFLNIYLEKVEPYKLLPQGQIEAQILLDCYLLEQAIHDIDLHLTNHEIPLLQISLQQVLDWSEQPI